MIVLHIQKTNFNQIFTNNYIKDIEFKEIDGVKRVAWNSDSKSFYLENENCVVVQEVVKQGINNMYLPNAYVVTNDAASLEKKEITSKKEKE